MCLIALLRSVAEHETTIATGQVVTAQGHLSITSLQFGHKLMVFRIAIQRSFRFRISLIDRHFVASRLETALAASHVITFLALYRRTH
jgi:hypothetical protein